MKGKHYSALTPREREYMVAQLQADLPEYKGITVATLAFVSDEVWYRYNGPSCNCFICTALTRVGYWGHRDEK